MYAAVVSLEVVGKLIGWLKLSMYENMKSMVVTESTLNVIG